MADAMQADPNVFIFGLDVPDHKRIFGSTAGLLEKFGPERVFGTPLSEDAMTGVTLGAALMGLRPVHVHIRVDFMLLGVNQIVNMISNLRYMAGGQIKKLPIVIRAVIGRGWGQSAQHSKSMQGLFAHFPGLKVIMPSSPQDAYSLTREAIEDDDPVIILEHRWMYDIVGEVDTALRVPIGSAHVRKTGKDLSLICTSWMNIEAHKAAEILERHGLSVEIVDVRSIAPFDSKTVIDSVSKTGRCIVADYDWSFCGFGAELAAQISHGCFGKLKQPIERLGFAHTPCPTTRPLENLFYPDAVDMVRTTEKMLGLKALDLSKDTFYTYEENFKGPF